MRALITGPTGAVGSEVLRLCLQDPAVESIVALSRRQLTVSGPKLTVLILDDFLNPPPLTGIDVCFYALGVSQTVVKDPTRYREITHDYTLALAQMVRAQNPNARFLFVSGQGADPAMQSRVLFARVKGETEVHLRELLRSRLTVFRPAYIAPSTPRATPMWQDTLLKPFLFLRGVLPWFFTDSREVAEAMLAAAHGVAVPAVLENRDVTAAAAKYRAR